MTVVSQILYSRLDPYHHTVSWDWRWQSSMAGVAEQVDKGEAESVSSFRADDFPEDLRAEDPRFR